MLKLTFREHQTLPQSKRQASPFLLPSETKLEDVDAYNKDFTSRINKKGHEVDLIQDEIKGIQEELDTYTNIDEVEKIIDSLRETNLSIQVKGEELDRLSFLLNKLEVLEGEADVLTKYLRAARYIRRAEETQEELSQLLVEKELITDVLALDELIQTQQEELKILEELYKIMTKQKELGVLLSLISRVKQLDDEIRTGEVDREEVRKEYKEELKRLGKCPTCFTNADSEMIKNIDSWL